MPLSLSEAIQSSPHWVMMVITLVLVATAVMLHFGCLNGLSRLTPRLNIARRRRVLLIIAVALLAHVVEIWLFGLGYWLAAAYPQLGTLHGADDMHLLECVYFSAATFSTAGYGDLAPLGPLRFLAGTESLTGFVLITWTASFTYLEMQRDWSGD